RLREELGCEFGREAPLVRGANRLRGFQGEQPANRVDARKLEKGGADPGQGVTIDVLAGDRANLERVPRRRFPAIPGPSPLQAGTSQLGDPPDLLIKAS